MLMTLIGVYYKLCIMKRTLLSLLIFSFIAGCASQSGPRLGTPTRYSSNHYLQMANNSTGTEQQAYLLQAADQLIDEKKIKRAQAVLADIKSPLAPNLQIKKQLVSAKVLIAYKQNADALSALQSLSQDHSAWPSQDQTQWLALTAEANENLGNLPAGIERRTEMIRLLPSQEQKAQTLKIWNRLQHLDPQQITAMSDQSNNKSVQGWLQLASIISKRNTSPQELANQLLAWQANYRGHPGNALLPANVQTLKSNSGHMATRVALLLPLTGPLGHAGNAVRNGFFAAYYEARERGEKTPEIIVVDTNQKNIGIAYKEALDKGANFVVGPLTKGEVTALKKSTRLSVPTLALNTINESDSNLYQFGLSPIDEAKQAAMKAWENHRKSALIIAPNNNWGKEIANQFNNTWRSLGGKVVGQLNYTNQKNLMNDIRSLLNIHRGETNNKNLRNILREKIRFVPRRRQDADMVFLISNPTMARQIKPMLSYFYADDLPVYSTSNVIAGHANAERDHDLNGIRFPEMPWVLKNQLKPVALNAVRQHAREIWPQSFRSQPKLIALGVDAYDILPKLNQMAVLPEVGIPGATGTLYLDNDRHVYRKLHWTRVRGGLPQAIQ